MVNRRFCISILLAVSCFHWIPARGGEVTTKPVEQLRSGQNGLEEFARLRKAYNGTRARVGLPKELDLTWRRADFERAFDLSIEFWEQGFKVDEFRKLIHAIADGTAPFEKEDGMFKTVRDRFKYLRFAFVAFSRDHEFPVQIDRIASTMGKLRGAMKKDEPEQPFGLARKAAKLPDEDAPKKMEKETLAFRS